MRPRRSPPRPARTSSPPAGRAAGQQPGEHRRVIQQRRRGGCLQRPDDGHRQQQPGGGGAAPAQRAAAGRADRSVVAAGIGGLGRGAVPDVPGRDHLPGVQRGGVPELGAVPQDGADVQDRLLAGERARADGDRAGLDHTGPRAVAGEVAVLADHRAGPDAQQVGAHRHVRGEDDRAAADLGAQRPQVQAVQRGTGAQPRQRVGRHQRLDHPEPEIGQAPHPDSAVASTARSGPISPRSAACPRPAARHRRSRQRARTPLISRGRPSPSPGRRSATPTPARRTRRRPAAAAPRTAGTGGCRPGAAPRSPAPAAPCPGCAGVAAGAVAGAGSAAGDEPLARSAAARRPMLGCR